MRVKIVYSTWVGDGFPEPLHGGEQDLEDVTEEQARTLAGAAAAGVVVIVEATPAERKLLDGHVQSQEDGEAAYAAAQESGRWQHGNLTDFIATREQRLADLGESDPDRGETLERRSELAAQIFQAREILATVEVPE